MSGKYLERETRCLAVSSYDEAGIGNKIETFTVGWEHGKTRIGIQAVPKAHGHAPKAKITVVSLSTRTVVINRKAETAFVAGTMGQAMNLLKTRLSQRGRPRLDWRQVLPDQGRPAPQPGKSNPHEAEAGCLTNQSAILGHSPAIHRGAFLWKEYENRGPRARGFRMI
jgi:hypothetical protein